MLFSSLIEAEKLWRNRQKITSYAQFATLNWPLSKVDTDEFAFTGDINGKYCVKFI